MHAFRLQCTGDDQAIFFEKNAVRHGDSGTRYIATGPGVTRRSARPGGGNGATCPSSLLNSLGDEDAIVSGLEVDAYDHLV